MRISVKDVAGKTCMTEEAGGLVYERVQPELQAGRPVELDFHGVTIFASPFFNWSIGRLFGDVTIDDYRRLVTIANLLPAGAQILDRVIENSSRYYTDPGHRQALDDILRQQAEET